MFKCESKIDLNFHILIGNDPGNYNVTKICTALACSLDVLVSQY